MEVPEFNIEQDEAFTLRMQFGSFLGDIMSWAVTLGQLPANIGELLANWDNVEDKDDPDVLKGTLTEIYEFVGHGLTGLVNLIQQSAIALYGEPFGDNDFTYNDLSLPIREASTVVNYLKDLSPEMLAELMSSDMMPDFLREMLNDMLNEEGEDNE